METAWLGFKICTISQVNFTHETMSNQEDQTFTDEAVTYGHTSSGNEQIPVVNDNSYRAEGMDAMDDQVKDSDAQLGMSHAFRDQFAI